MKKKKKVKFKEEDKNMAKNWKVGEAVRAIQAGNKEDILDIGRRFPLFANLAAQINEAGATLLDCVPEYCSARKIESVLKDGVQESTEDEGAEDAVEEAKPAKKAEKKAPAKKAAKKEEVEEDEDDSLESKSAKELFEMCKAAGLKVKAKQDKAVYIEALNAANEDAEDEEEDWGDSEEEEEAPKKDKKAPAKAAEKKKPAKKAEEDDDEDWEV